MSPRGAGSRQNLRNRWFGSHATQGESNHEDSSFTPGSKDDYASTAGERVSFIISLRRQGGIFIDYKFSDPMAAQKRGWEGQKRGKSAKGQKEGVVIYEGPARGSFHTFLQSSSSLSSWKELIFMSVLERTLGTHTARATNVYTFHEDEVCVIFLLHCTNISMRYNLLMLFTINFYCCLFRIFSINFQFTQYTVIHELGHQELLNRFAPILTKVFYVDYFMLV